MKAAGYYDFEALKVMTGRRTVKTIKEVLDKNGINYIEGHETISTCPEAIVNKKIKDSDSEKPKFDYD